MTERGELVRRREAWHDRGKDAPHRAVDVRAGGGHVYSIVIEGTGELLGTADEHRAYATLHPGAVYLHLGEQYLVQELDLVQRVAVVRERRPRLLHAGARRHRHRGGRGALRGRASATWSSRFGSVRVTNQVVSYVRKLGLHERDARRVPAAAAAGRARDPRRVVDDPRRACSTGPAWGPATCRARSTPPSTPRSACCRSWPPATAGTSAASRRRCIPTPASRRSSSTTAIPGGAGITERGAATSDRWLRATLEAIRQCPCSRGCPTACSQPEVRQRQRAARQAGRDRAARRLPRRALGLGRPRRSLLPCRAACPAGTADPSSIADGYAARNAGSSADAGRDGVLPALCTLALRHA